MTNSGEAETDDSPTPQGLRRGRIPVEARRSCPTAKRLETIAQAF